jgi:hypothetical protein
MVRILLFQGLGKSVDTQEIMSATASVSMEKSIVEALYWRAFAPIVDDEYAMALVTGTVEKPQFSLKSKSLSQGEMRFRLSDRLALAGLVHKAEVQVAFPFVRNGREYELEVLNVISERSGHEGWVSARYLGLEFTFFDVLHALGKARHQPGEKRRFVLNALALSLKRVPKSPDCFSDHSDDGEIGFPTTGFRAFVQGGRGLDDGIFQSPIDGEPQKTVFDEREFDILPVSLVEENEEKRLTVDLLVAPEILETFDKPLESGDEVAGIVWLHGYSPELLK